MGRSYRAAILVALFRLFYIGECRSTTVFDFIVVGGGTSGSVIAARLSEECNWNILLLEAGGDPPITSDVPYFYQNLQRTDIDWEYQTIREKGLYNGLMGRVNRWPAGKVMGGTSSMGVGLYIRGNYRDFDNLAAVGNTGWSSIDVLPYFKKSEDMRAFHIITSPISNVYHSTGGPLTVSGFATSLDLARLILNTTHDLGCPHNRDINGVRPNGFTYPNVGTVYNGERLNTAKAFLNPVKFRPNLFVIKHAYVIKILICKKNRRAFGVEYYYRNERKPRTLRAAREVIISAGTVGSARLLLLSGIGPKNHLENLGICVQSNLRVGHNLRDSVMFPLIPITINFSEKQIGSALSELDETYEYLTRRKGKYASIGITEIVGMVRSHRDDSPDVFIMFMFIERNNSGILIDFLRNIGFEMDIVLQIMEMHYNSNLLLPLVTLIRPESEGRISLKSSDPDDVPLIEAKYLDEPVDYDNIMAGIRFVEKIGNHEYFKAHNSTVRYINYPGCCGLKPGTDHYWACALSHVAGTGYSPIGTCKMGPCNDPNAVVDPALRVYGMKGLRVADASILPNAFSGPNMAAVIMIGEKVSDLIKFQWLPDFVPKFTTQSHYTRPSTIKIPTKKRKGDNVLEYVTRI